MLLSKLNVKMLLDTLNYEVITASESKCMYVSLTFKLASQISGVSLM